MSAILASTPESPARPAFPRRKDLSACEPAIDLVHLARQTDNDSALEEELLGLFDRQSASLLAQLSAEDAPRRRRADAAHMLRGSALALGAGPVARAAQAVETSLESANAEKFEIETAMAALAEAIAEARAVIARLRG
ncbi:MAG TPA: Hpt domain-containing protein [Roseiarcus sp.]|nr:Hpt domain-containing protein [Roseiarcus sp.]